jgi:hypothetical protein
MPDPMLSSIVEHFNKSETIDKLTMFDIGCSNGSFTGMAKSVIKKPSVWYGIDPINYCVNGNMYYDHRLHIAIDDVPTAAEQEFNVYADSGCSSLLPIKHDNITYDPAEKDSKWYYPCGDAYNNHFDRIVEKRLVTVKPMSQVIQEHALQDEIIHFVKIDVQGKDIPAVKSFNSYIKNVLYVQIESVISQDKNNVLYEGQTHFEDDEAYMESIVFSIYHIESRGLEENSNLSPEADVIFINNELRDI